MDNLLASPAKIEDADIYSPICKMGDQLMAVTSLNLTMMSAI
jgi:hypothetical protein